MNGRGRGKGNARPCVEECGFPLAIFPIFRHFHCLVFPFLPACGGRAHLDSAPCSPLKVGRDAFFRPRLEAAGASGLLLMSLIFTPLVTSFGWRSTGVLFALFGVPIVFLLVYTGFDNSIPKAEPNDGTEEIGVRPFILFVLSRGFHLIGLAGVISLLPVFAVGVWGVPPEKSSIFPLFMYLGMIPMDVITGKLSENYNPLKIISILIFGVIPTILLITLDVPILTVFPILSVIGACGAGSWPPQGYWLSRTSPSGQRGKRFGALIGSLNIPQSFSPFLIGVFAGVFNLANAYRLAVLPILVGGILMVYAIKENGK